MHRQLENWMDRAFAGSSDESTERRLTLTPRMDIAETEKGYELTADLPGMKDKDVDISVSSDVLTITGERGYEQESDGRSVHLSERGFGAFKRSFSLPDDVDQDQIQARLKNGVLAIFLPKAEEAAPPSRQIKVRTS
jgi:HSP20 family protein